MPPRGAFSAKRKAFLESKQANFTAAVENSRTANGLAVIFRQYFKRFPIDLDDNVEPTDNALATVDDNAADPDLEEPSDSLGPEEHAAALKALKARQAHIQAKRGVSCALFGVEGVTHTTCPATHSLVYIPLHQTKQCQPLLSRS